MFVIRILGVWEVYLRNLNLNIRLSQLWQFVLKIKERVQGETNELGCKCLNICIRSESSEGKQTQSFQNIYIFLYLLNKMLDSIQRDELECIPVHFNIVSYLLLYARSDGIIIDYLTILKLIIFEVVWFTFDFRLKISSKQFGQNCPLSPNAVIQRMRFRGFVCKDYGRLTHQLILILLTKIISPSLNRFKIQLQTRIQINEKLLCFFLSNHNKYSQQQSINSLTKLLLSINSI
ncbi:unnamed protein product [Paramecium octaurelia]|uniref:Uncharacterized protein n=1 Tax=Paramecium octaurelia TaxID=43137 RepID=A0A8S1XRE3_PAROT|nr:unnamed protein product [Paramecium octaurelia]